MHMSALISNKVIFNRSPAALRFCARISLRRITADDLTLTKGNVTLAHLVSPHRRAQPDAFDTRG